MVHHCKTCVFWQRPQVGADVDLRNMPPGECHVGPPAVQIVPLSDGKGGMTLQNVSVWPPKVGSDWCGCHQDFGS